MTLAFNGASLHFTPQAEPPAQELVEYKACEGYGCGRFFYRPKPANAREGERVCPGCRERELAAREQRDVAPKIDGRRKYEVERLDFLMRQAKAPPSYVPHCGLGFALRGGRLVKTAEFLT